MVNKSNTFFETEKNSSKKLNETHRNLVKREYNGTTTARYIL